MKVLSTFENMGKCICYQGTCATFAQNNLSGGLFCSIARYAESLERRGCVCDSCLIWHECGLTELYFCAEGSEER
jgi:hypothetical protein